MTVAVELQPEPYQRVVFDKPQQGIDSHLHDNSDKRELKRHQFFN